MHKGKFYLAVHSSKKTHLHFKFQQFNITPAQWNVDQHFKMEMKLNRTAKIKRRIFQILQANFNVGLSVE